MRDPNVFLFRVIDIKEGHTGVGSVQLQKPSPKSDFEENLMTWWTPQGMPITDMS